MSSDKHIAIVGAGITGLAAAWELNRIAPETQVTIFESSDRVGGVLQTEKIDEYLVEASADMFSCEPAAAIELCRQLGIEDELLVPVMWRTERLSGSGTRSRRCPGGFR